MHHKMPQNLEAQCLCTYLELMKHFTSTKIPRTTVTTKIKENISITYKNTYMYKFSYP